MNGLLLWCAGAVEPRAFEGLATERTRYVSLGLTVWIPAGLAAIGGCLALGLLTDNWWLRGLGAALWASLVFVIDRALIVTLRRDLAVDADGDGTRSSRAHASPWKAWARASLLVGCRLAIAATVGTIVAHALVLQLFSAEIEERLEAELQHQTETLSRQTEAKLQTLADQARAEEQKLEALRTERRRLELERVRENAGSGLSGRPGEGRVWRDLVAAIASLNRDLAQAEEQWALSRIRFEEEAARARQTLDSALVRREANQARGYMARARALDAVTADSVILRRANRLLLAFLVLLELMPVVVKLLVIRGPYAGRIANTEWQADEATAVAVEAQVRTRPERLRMRIRRLPWMTAAPQEDANSG